MLRLVQDSSAVRQLFFRLAGAVLSKSEKKAVGRQRNVGLQMYVKAYLRFVCELNMTMLHSLPMLSLTLKTIPRILD